MAQPAALGTLSPIRPLVHTLPWLALFFLLPSTALLERLGGLGAVLLYLLLGGALLAWGGPRPLALCTWLTEPRARALLLLTMAGLTLLFLLLYPMLDQRGLQGGSDGDDALELAVGELLAGRYPYYSPTYLGNPITPLPGALLLALPFTLLGRAAFQNLFWLALFLWTLYRWGRGSQGALSLLWTLLLLAPLFLYTLLIGSDYLANTLYVLLALAWAGRARQGWAGWAAPLFLGLALSSRLHFLLLLPPFATLLWQQAGGRHALQSLLLAGLAFLVVTLPFYLYDPPAFSPLHTLQKFGLFQQLMTPLGVLFACALALPRLNQGWAPFWRNAALIQALPIVMGILVASLWVGRPTFVFARYGTFMLLFGALASWWALVVPEEAAHG